MRLTHLLLTDYRNIERLEIDLPGRVGVFVGENAHGKSNILEAIYMLATIRAARAEQDAQVIRRAARMNAWQKAECLSGTMGGASACLTATGPRSRSRLTFLI